MFFGFICIAVSEIQFIEGENGTTIVVYGYSSSRICGGSMEIGPLRITGSHVTGSDVSHVTGSGISYETGSDVSHVARNRKYVLRMRNRTLRNISPFSPEVTSIT